MTIFPILAVLGGLFVINQSKKSKTSSSTSTSTPLPTDKGYNIIVPCKIFDIYNEEQSYIYAYHRFTKLLKEMLAKAKIKDISGLSKLAQDFQIEMFGCDWNKIQDTHPVFDSPQYYAWGYRILRAGFKALVDNRILISKTLTEEHTIATADQLLHEYLNLLQEKGFDIQGLPTTVEGDFIQ